MRTFALVVTLIWITLLSVVDADENDSHLLLTYDLPEKFVLPLKEEDSNKFELIHQAQTPNNNYYVQEWVPKGQTLDNWQEMITICFDKVIDSNPKRLEYNLKSNYSLAYPNSFYKVRTLHKSKDELVVLLEVPNGHKKIPPFSVITRCQFTPEGVHQVFYEKRFNNISDANQREWIKKIKKAFIAKNTDRLYANRFNFKPIFESILGEDISKWEFPIEPPKISQIPHNEMAHVDENHLFFEKLRVGFCESPTSQPPSNQVDCIADAYTQLNELTAGNFKINVLSSSQYDIIYEAILDKFQEGIDEKPHNRIYRQIVCDNGVCSIVYVRYDLSLKMDDDVRNYWVDRISSVNIPGKKS